MQVWTSHSGVAADWVPGNGWNRVLPAFTTLSDLLSELDAAGMRGQVDALAIVAHGATMASSVPGEVRISPTLSPESVARASVADSVRRLGDFIRVQIGSRHPPSKLVPGHLHRRGPQRAAESEGYIAKLPATLRPSVPSAVQFQPSVRLS